jgi:hypothetical protein
VSGKRTLQAIVVATAGIILVSGAAFAFKTTGSTTPVSATTGETMAVVISQAAPTVFLTPGRSVPLRGTVANPNAEPVTFTGFAATIESIKTTHGQAARPCTPEDYFLDGGPQLTGTDSSDIPALGQVEWEGMTLHMIRDDTSSQDDCAGAVVNIAYTTTP